MIFIFKNLVEMELLELIYYYDDGDYDNSL